MAICVSSRATGPWLFQNCGWCDSTAAPGFAEQVMAGTNPGGRPKDLPYPNPEEFLKTVGEGLKVNRSKAERSHPGVCPPRAGLGPAPTKRNDGLFVRRRGGSKTRPSRDLNMFL